MISFGRTNTNIRKAADPPFDTESAAKACAQKSRVALTSETLAKIQPKQNAFDTSFGTALNFMKCLKT